MTPVSGTAMGEKSFQPTLSVIVPTYNRAAVVVFALESLFNQTYPALEVIVVDDGSEDDTLHVLEQMTDSRLRVVATKNQGANAARNRGAAEASGAFISFLDSDDTLESRWAEIMMALLAHADVASCGYLKVRGSRVEQRSARPLLADQPETLSNFNHAGTYALPKELFHEVGAFDEELASSQHTELGLRIAKYSRNRPLIFATTSEFLLRYHAGSEDSIRSDWAALADGLEHILRKHADIYESDRRLKADSYYRLGVRQLRTSAFKSAAQSFLQSSKSVPSAKSILRLSQASAKWAGSFFS